MLQMHVWIYLACLVGSSACALAFGQWPERCAAGLNMAGTLISFILSLVLPDQRWTGTMAATFAIDLMVCLGFLLLMLESRRLWLIPCFGLTTVTVLAHAARMLSTQLSPRVYYLTEAIWAYAILLLVAIGTWRHPRTMTATTTATTTARS